MNLSRTTPPNRVTQSLPAQVASPPAFQQYSESFTYDAVGNRLTGPTYPKTFGYTQSYTYDYDNRLTGVTKQIPGSPNPDTITFKYDPFGRRIEKNVSTVENGIPTTYKYTYVYDNEDIILEVLDKTQNAVTTTTTTSYVHGPGIDEPLSLERNGQKYYYHADGLGSITSMTDNTQAVVNRYSYDSFGNVQRAETVWNDFTYTGREYDYETGKYYLRARYYDPETGKFISKDPIGFAGGDVNVYNYTSGNPVNWVDPWGLFRSPEILRLLVPGQIAWDDSMTSLENRDYLGAVLNAVTMIGEDALAVLTWGGGSVAKQGSQCILRTAEHSAPRNLAEQLAMEEAKNNPPTKRILEEEIKDPRYNKDLWAKMQYVHKSLDGSKIVLHYWENLKTGLRTRFKYK